MRHRVLRQVSGVARVSGVGIGSLPSRVDVRKLKNRFWACNLQVRNGVRGSR